MRVSGMAVPGWSLVFGPLHDALMEDALDRASALTGTPFRPASWSIPVQVLRAVLRALGPAGRDT